MTIVVEQMYALELPDNPVDVTALLPYYRSSPIVGELIEVHSSCSMLHVDVLTLLYHFAANTKGRILEIGPCAGGSTIAMAKGMKSKYISKPIISVELNGPCNHPQFHTDNIIRMLQRNLSRYGLSNYVNIIEGNSRDVHTIAKVKQELQGEKIGLFVIDADGKVAEDFFAYHEMLADEFYMIVDDYYSPGSDKGPQTIDGIIEIGNSCRIVPLGIYGWGTWIGKVFLR